MKILKITPKAGVIVSMLVLQFLVNSCSTDPGTGNTKPDTTVNNIRQPQLHKIEINQMKFDPSELKVKKGDKVVFVNSDIVTHDVTEEKNKSWTSDPLKPGEYWTLVVTESAQYFCSLHPVMKGKIIVE
ncbi:MAG: plastocyanin/azurin family copper-binding protein [Bacteroidota bacterium]